MNTLTAKCISRIAAVDSNRLQNIISKYYDSATFKNLAPSIIDQTYYMISNGKLLYGVPYEVAHNYYLDDLSLSPDPNSITGYVSKRAASGNKIFRTKFYFIATGSWDIHPDLFDRHETAIEMKDLLDCNGEFSKSESYKKRIDEMNAGAPRKHRGIYLDSTEKINAYYTRYLRIIDSMRQHGYKPQKSLRGSDVEIGVAIGRNGELLCIRKGHHRLAIAKSLGLERVAVSVRLIHHEWLYKCMEKTGKSPHESIRAGLASMRTSNH